MKIYSVLFFYLFAQSCINTNPQIKEIISTDNDNSKLVNKFEIEQTGFMWSSCHNLSVKALKEASFDEEDYRHFQKMEWYDYNNNKWITKPVCNTEYYWIIGSLFTLWWPEATKVKLRVTKSKFKAAAPNSVAIKKVLDESSTISYGENFSRLTGFDSEDKTWILGFNPLPSFGFIYDFHSKYWLSGSIGALGFVANTDLGVYAKISKWGKEDISIGSKIGGFGILSNWGNYQTISLNLRLPKASLELNYAFGKQYSYKLGTPDQPGGYEASPISGPLFSIFWSL